MPAADILVIPLSGHHYRAASLFIVFFMVMGVAALGEPVEAFPHFALSPWGWALEAALALVVLYMLLMRSGVSFDRQSKQFGRWHGPWFPLFHRRSPLPETPHLEMRMEQRRSASQRSGPTRYYKVFALRLNGQAGEGPCIHDCSSHQAARDLAERICKHLGCALHDSTEGATVVREAAYLDESLAQRHRRLGERVSLPRPPPQARARVAQDGGSFHIRIPATGFDLREFLFALLIAAGLALPFLGIVALFAGLDGLTGGLWLAGLMLMAAGGGALYMQWYREDIRVSAAGISVRQGVFWRPRQQLPGEAIEELLEPGGGLGTRLSSADMDRLQAELAKAGVDGGLLCRGAERIGIIGKLLLRSDHGTIAVGWRLGTAEKRWLKDMILYALVQPGGGAAPVLSGGHLRPRVGGGEWLVKLVLALVFLAGMLGYHLEWPTRISESLQDWRDPPEPLAPLPDVSAFLMKPQYPGNAIDIFAHGISVQARDGAVIIGVGQIVLLRNGAQRRIGFDRFELELWGVGAEGLAAQQRQVARPVKGQIRRDAHLLAPADQVFVFEGQARTCTLNPCYIRFRLEREAAGQNSESRMEATDLTGFRLTP